MTLAEANALLGADPLYTVTEVARWQASRKTAIEPVFDLLSKLLSITGAHKPLPPQVAQRDLISKPVVVATPVPDLRVVPQTEATPRRTTRTIRTSAAAPFFGAKVLLFTSFLLSNSR